MILLPKKGGVGVSTNTSSSWNIIPLQTALNSVNNSLLPHLSIPMKEPLQLITILLQDSNKLLFPYKMKEQRQRCAFRRAISYTSIFATGMPVVPAGITKCTCASLSTLECRSRILIGLWFSSGYIQVFKDKVHT